MKRYSNYVQAMNINVVCIRERVILLMLPYYPMIIVKILKVKKILRMRHLCKGFTLQVLVLLYNENFNRFLVHLVNLVV